MYLTVINILFMLSLLFSIIINLITTVITGVLMYISFALGILNEKNIDFRMDNLYDVLLYF